LTFVFIKSLSGIRRESQTGFISNLSDEIKAQASQSIQNQKHILQMLVARNSKQL
jgi:hypothetical protein